jgi:hypothetical protein
MQIIATFILDYYQDILYDLRKKTDYVLQISVFINDVVYG